MAIITDLEHYRDRREGLQSSAPSYTLADLRSLTRQFLNDMENHGHATTYGPDSLTDWKFETFLQWLIRREKEVEDASNRRRS